ncbi:MAG: type II toxin-antitoxin system prevent-host-death family antitoxin [Rhodocyclaceae bacterium]|nr:type II toxin-antitoxin system prevent-host-death family antitoxin [Rhodocyclaceae bacterium]
MTAIAYSQFRHRLGEVVEDMMCSGEPVTVTRADGKNFVVVPVEEWDSVNQTAHLLSNEENTRRLRESSEQARAGRLVERDID